MTTRRRVRWAGALAWLVACADSGGATTEGGTAFDGSTSSPTTPTTTLAPTTGIATDALTAASEPTTTDTDALDPSTTASEPTTTDTDALDPSTTDPAPVCGDGMVDRGEECDDGPNNGDMNACTVDCKAAVCGDGLVGPGEACDDADRVDGDECTNVCTLPSCGDGIVGPAEECDAGADNDDLGACTLACMAAACGDGFVQAGVEACDDGNADDTDACVAGCAAAKCGDGFVQAGVEDCDDGGQTDGDGCSAQCKSEVCATFVNGSDEDVKTNDWLDACVALPGKTVTVRMVDANDVVVYEASGPKVGVWSQDQITSTVANIDQYLASNHDRAISLGNGDKLLITGKNAANYGCGGSVGNGYAVLIYPSVPNYYSNIKLFVAPYRHFNDYPNPNVPLTGMPRLLGGWSTATEIAWKDGATMNSCDAVVTGFTGKFTVTITP